MRAPIVAMLAAIGALMVPASAAAADPTCDWTPFASTFVTEGHTGTTQASIDLVCANPTSETFVVRFATLDGTAASPADYAARQGEFSVPPGDSGRTLAVDVQGDTRPEAEETLGIVLTEAAGRVTLPSTALVNIEDDDGFVVSSVTRSAPEGDRGSTVVDVEVQLGDPLEHPFAVTLGTEDITATAGSDYEFTSQRKTFAPGEVSKTYSITVLGDTDVEPDETVFLALGAEGGVTLSSGYLTIVDDDEATPAGACIVLSETSVEVRGTFSTPSTGRIAGPVPTLTVTNCGTSDVNLNARGTDATGPDGTWELTDDSSGTLCELGTDLFRADLLWASDGGGFGTSLTTQDKVVLGEDGSAPFVLGEAATQEFSPEIELPCVGSVGLGDPMTTQITLTAVAP